MNTFPNINLDNRKSEDAKQLKSYLEACVSHSRDELFTLLYMRGGWYFLSLLVDIAISGNMYTETNFGENLWSVAKHFKKVHAKTNGSSLFDRTWHFYEFSCSKCLFHSKMACL